MKARAGGHWGEPEPQQHVQQLNTAVQPPLGEGFGGLGHYCVNRDQQETGLT